jgi:hypothetical protein
MTHEEVTDLLASYALDAVLTNEHDQIEAHLAECPRCRSELDGYREVAAAMGNSVEPLPEGLWSSIASRLPERPQEATPPPMPRLVGARRGSRTAAADAMDNPVLPPRRQRFAKGPVATIGSLAVAAAAVATVFGIGLVRADNTVNNDNKALAAPRVVTISAETAALRTPGHKIVELANGTADVAKFVVLPDGRGYLVSSLLPALPSTQEYQLWGIEGSKAISLGLLGTKPSRSAFTMAGMAPSRLSLTVEPNGGSTTPSAPIVASGVV